MIDLKAIIDEREAEYGSFFDKAVMIQGLKETVRLAPNWRKLASDQREALDMLMHKLGRVLYGNPDHLDSWVDAAAYLKLVADRISKEEMENEQG